MAPIRITDAQRRARLVARHHLRMDAADVDEVARAVVAIHSSDPATPHLGAWARVSGYATTDLDAALHSERRLVRVHAMRRTLFVVPAHQRGLFDAAVGRDVATKERRRLLGWLEAEMGADRAAPWLAATEEATLAALGGSELSTAELAQAVPDLRTEISAGTGKWVTRAPVSSRVLFLLALDGRILRGRPLGTWRSSQYRWVRADVLDDAGADPMDVPHARAELARRYLAAHGPVTMTDLRWWTGWTVAQTKDALARLDVRTVALDAGEGLVLDDDASPGPAATTRSSEGPVIAFLPGLDPTPMGWKDRSWYMRGHTGEVFDRNGNVGPTVCVDGAVVGGWAQRPDGEVIYRLLETVGPEPGERIAERAAALTAWLDGTVVTPRFPSPLDRALARP